ncbi:hypothetical protein G6F56_003378 [Rhizopus delemar]|nr:hypothetical protein G6F56_003378 [Rhizopus delemar]
MNINELSEEQLLELLELSRSLKIEQEKRERRSIQLPTEILKDLETAPKNELTNNTKRFQKSTIQYDGGNWSKPGGTNKIFTLDLKKYNLDTFTAVGYRFKDAERLRTAGKTAAEIFKDLKVVLEREGSEQDEEQLTDILKKKSDNYQYMDMQLGRGLKMKPKISQQKLYVSPQVSNT